MRDDPLATMMEARVAKELERGEGSTEDAIRRALEVDPDDRAWDPLIRLWARRYRRTGGKLKPTSSTQQQSSDQKRGKGRWQTESLKSARATSRRSPG